MTFLNPLALIGLAAAALPLVIHLLGRRRPRTVRFSAMAFLSELRRHQFRRLQFRNWLLLALRTLAILFLVLAFARPAIRTTFGALGERGASATVVVLDDGPSMAYDARQGQRLDWGRRQLTDLVSLVAPNDWAVLLRTSKPDIVLPFDMETLENVTETAGWSGDGAAALRHAAELLGRSDAANRELFVVSDLAGPPWERAGHIDWPPRVAAYLVVPADEPTTNLSVDSVSAGRELIRPGRPLAIQATIRNTGETDIPEAAVALWINDRRVQQNSVSVPAGGRVLVQFSSSLEASGWVSGRIELPDDPLVLDNSRWFALSVPPETRLIIIGDDTPSRRNLVALFTSTERRAPYVPIAVEPGSLTEQLFERADVIILNERMTLDDRAVGWLRDALRRGAGLLVLLGPGTDLREANQRIMPLVSKDQFTGLRSATGRDSTAYFTVDAQAATDPLIADLLVPGPSSQPRFVDYVMIRSSRRNVLLSFTTGDPWIIVGEGDAGRSAILTAGLNAAWSDLAYRGVVVPLMHRLVNQLARPVSLIPEYRCGAGGRRSLQQAATRLELESPDGIRRALTPLNETRTPVLDLGPLDQPGIWTVRADEKVVDLFAVNLHPSESELRPRDRKVFQREVGLDDVTLLGENPARTVAQARRGTELDILFIVAALGCLVAEMILMRGIASSGARASPSAERGPAQVV